MKYAYDMAFIGYLKLPSRHILPDAQKYKIKVCFQTETIGCLKDNRRFIPLRNIVSSLDQDAIKILPIVHFLSAFDFTYICGIYKG